VVIVNTQAVGDWMVLVPSLYELSKSVERVDFVANDLAASFLETLPFLRRCRLDAPVQLHYSGLVDFQDTYFGMERAKLSHRISADWRVGVARGGYRPWRFDEHVRKEIIHLTEHASRLLRTCSNPASLNADMAARFKWPSLSDGVELLEKRGWAKDGSLRIGIHAPNKNRLKRWLPERFAELIQSLNQKYAEKSKTGKVRFFVTGLEGERDQTAPILAALPSALRAHVTDLTGELSPAGLIELVRSLDLLVTVDTSLFHIAGMTRTPTIVLFGPTDLRYWSAWGDRQHSLSLELPCRPTENLGRTLALDDRCCPFESPRCMTQIMVSQVMAEAEKLLG
jgi:ADP-heptose:LPS heptosyltransferase